MLRFTRSRSRYDVVAKHATSRVIFQIAKLILFKRRRHAGKKRNEFSRHLIVSFVELVVDPPTDSDFIFLRTEKNVYLVQVCRNVNGLGDLLPRIITR